MSSLIHLGRIDYLNVWPVYYAFDAFPIPGNIRVHSDSPARLNAMLAEGKLDVSAISAFNYALYPEELLLLPDLSIACDGPVMSVLLLSRLPFKDLDGLKIALSEDSASAACLLRFLLQDSSLSCYFERKKIKGIEDLSSVSAALVIGDTALSYNWPSYFPYIYDLGSLWKEKTGLPFVFGLWAVRRSFFEKNQDAVFKLLAYLLDSKKEGIKSTALFKNRALYEKKIKAEVFDAYFNCLFYDLPSSALSGLKLYYKYMEEMSFIKKAPELLFIDDL